MDVGTGLALFGSAKLIERMLGPTADYFGGELKEWTRKRLETAKRIFTKAERKLGDRINAPGAVSPRIAHQVIEEGSICEDELQQEYLAGVLAASRTPDGQDDSGVEFLGMLRRLPAVQVRAHYVLYSVIRGTFMGVNDHPQRRRASFARPHTMALWFTMQEFSAALGRRDATAVGLIARALNALRRESLIGESFGVGLEDDLRQSGFMPDRTVLGTKQPAVAFMPSVSGAHFFAWAHGVALDDTDDLINPGVTLPPGPSVSLPNASGIDYIQPARARRPNSDMGARWA